eukprot:457910_1
MMFARNLAFVLTFIGLLHCTCSVDKLEYSQEQWFTTKKLNAVFYRQTLMWCDQNHLEKTESNIQLCVVIKEAGYYTLCENTLRKIWFCQSWKYFNQTSIPDYYKINITKNKKKHNVRVIGITDDGHSISTNTCSLNSSKRIQSVLLVIFVIMLVYLIFNILN